MAQVTEHDTIRARALNRVYQQRHRQRVKVSFCCVGPQR